MISIRYNDGASLASETRHDGRERDAFQAQTLRHSNAEPGVRHWPSLFSDAKGIEETTGDGISHAVYALFTSSSNVSAISTSLKACMRKLLRSAGDRKYLTLRQFSSTASAHLRDDCKQDCTHACASFAEPSTMMSRHGSASSLKKSEGSASGSIAGKPQQ